MHCREVEALIQNVLSFPNMPVRIHRLLPSITADINSMTRFVESMAAHFGKELTLCYIRKQPRLLNLDFDTVLKRCSNMREMLGIRDSDIPMMLRKCPQLLLVDSSALKAAYDHIPRVVGFTPALVSLCKGLLYGSTQRLHLLLPHGVHYDCVALVSSCRAARSVPHLLSPHDMHCPQPTRVQQQAWKHQLPPQCNCVLGYPLVTPAQQVKLQAITLHSNLFHLSIARPLCHSCLQHAEYRCVPW
jgi:hypothetical protein